MFLYDKYSWRGKKVWELEVIGLRIMAARTAKAICNG
jgi:hypothetical protein